MTMGPDPGGIFDTLLRLVRTGLGGRAASGKQFISWIHEADFVRAIDFLIEHQESGWLHQYLLALPIAECQDFMRVLRQAWGTRIGLPATRWMLELGAIFLRTETELILKSRRVVPQRLLESGFRFNFANWSNAADDLVKHWREKHARA